MGDEGEGPEASTGDGSETSTDDARGGGSACRNCGLGCLGFLILLALLVGVMNSSAGARLDARRQSLQGEIAAVREELGKPRQTLLQSAGDEGNALRYYNGVEWVLAGGNPEHLRPSWVETKPALPADIDEVVAVCSPEGAEIDSIAPASPIAAYLPEFRTYRDPSATPPAADAINGVAPADLRKGLEVFARYRPVLRYVRAGLKQQRCDWATEFEKGARAEFPNLLYFRAVSSLLAYEAMLQPPKEALTTGLEIVALAEDLSRHGTLIGDMVSVSIAAMGLRSLGQTLGREGLDAADYRRVIDALARYRAPATAASFERERLMMVVTALEISGRPLVEGDPAAIEDGLEVGVLGKLDLLNARELEGYEYFTRKFVDVLELPLAQQDAALLALDQEVRDSSYLLVKIATPNLYSIARTQRRAIGLARVTRVVAAAHLRRLEGGSFPAQIEALSALVGADGILDPTAKPPAPLRYRLEDEVLTCWIVEENATDDGGPGAAGDDSGISTHAPRVLKLQLPPKDQ